MRAVFVALACSLIVPIWGPGAAAQSAHRIELADRVVQLPADQWREIHIPEPFAVRFEARSRQKGEVVPQLLTIFKLPMQVNDRVGVSLTGDELADFLFLYPVKVTYRMRLDRGSFWVESLQTFEVPIGRPLRVKWQLQQTPSRDEIFTLLDTYDLEIKRARFQLRQLF